MTSTKEPAIFRALETFVYGRSGFVAEGTRTRNPVGPIRYWLAEPCTDDEIEQAKQQLEDDREQAATARRAQPAPFERLNDPDRTVVVVREFEDLNYTVRKGTKFPADHVLVARFPECFEEVRS